MMTRLLATGGSRAFRRKEYCGLAKRRISGDRPVIPDPAGPAARFTMTSARRLAVGSLPVIPAVVVGAFPRFGTWCLPSITSTRMDTVLYYPNPILIPGWVWRE